MLLITIIPHINKALEMTSFLHGTIPLKVMEEDLPRREGVGPEGRALLTITPGWQHTGDQAEAGKQGWDERLGHTAPKPAPQSLQGTISGCPVTQVLWWWRNVTSGSLGDGWHASATRQLSVKCWIQVPHSHLALQLRYRRLASLREPLCRKCWAMEHKFKK